MAQFTSTTEGTWVEILSVNLQAEYEQLQQLIAAGDHEGSKVLQEQIKSLREGEVDSTTASALTSFYETQKPTVTETDTYQLIAIDVTETGGTYTGILNCRVNGEHIQVRF